MQLLTRRPVGVHSSILGFLFSVVGVLGSCLFRRTLYTQQVEHIFTELNVKIALYKWIDGRRGAAQPLKYWRQNVVDNTHSTRIPGT